ncbi:hypothetical protein AB0333_14645 [Citricoccus sp. NPDC079358]|uniref:hypothetical protein n=1 Tax=Citricoccus sp. NPDC079358 TaxID=3154653 RepID=UPI003450B5B0
MPTVASSRPHPPRTPSSLSASSRWSAGLRLRQLCNAANLTTPLGLVLALASGCRIQRGPEGLILAFGYRWAFPDGGAFTVGNLVLFRPHTAPTARLLEHEGRHATQYAWCLGLPFLVLYFTAAGWSVLRTGDPASRNLFERHAGLAAGGYRERPVRWPRRR